MKKRNLSKSVLAAALFVAFNASASDATIAIDSCEALDQLGQTPKGSFQLTSNIDCSGYTVSPQGVFRGQFDGQGFTISNLAIQGSEGDVGLFDQVVDAEISNVVFDGATVILTDEVKTVGVLSGRAYDSQLSNIHVTNSSVNASYEASLGAAMIVGTTDSVDATNISVTGSNLYVVDNGAAGQLFGRTKYGTLTELTSSNNVTDIGTDEQNFVGGIIGNAYSSKLVLLHSNDNRISGQTLEQGKVGLLVGQLTSDSSINTADLSGDYIDTPLNGSSDLLDVGIMAGFIYNPIDDEPSLANITANDVGGTLVWYNKKSSETGIVTENITVN